MRLFVAITPDASSRAVLARSAELVRAKGLPGARVVASEKLHITLHFLGSVDAAKVDTLVVAYRQAAGLFAPLELELWGAGAFPSAARAKVIWTGVRRGASALQTLASRVSEVSEKLGITPEPRRFHPHLTLAYLKPSSDVSALLHEVDAEQPPVVVVVPEMVLMRSHTDHAGSRYEVLATFPLDGSAG
jgi:2'-5' RNA ligase